MATVTAVLPALLQRRGNCAVMICNYGAVALIHRAARISGAWPLQHKRQVPEARRRSERPRPHDKGLPASIRETFLKVCLTKMSIKEC